MTLCELTPAIAEQLAALRVAAKLVGTPGDHFVHTCPACGYAEKPLAAWKLTPPEAGRPVDVRNLLVTCPGCGFTRYAADYLVTPIP